MTTTGPSSASARARSRAITLVLRAQPSSSSDTGSAEPRDGAGQGRGEPFACRPGPSAPPQPARPAGQLRDDRGAEVRRDVPAQHGAVRHHGADRGHRESEDEPEDEPDRGVGDGGPGQGVPHRARCVHDLGAGDELGRPDARLRGALVEVGDP